MNLDQAALQSHFDQLSARLGLSPVDLAEGVLDVANTTMERAIKVISVERGFDPREFTLFSFGGAGGLHAAYLARNLNIPEVFIPCNPGILSAAGMLMSDVIKDYSQTVMLGGEEIIAEALKAHFHPLESRGRDDLLEEGVSADRIILERYLDMRYQGQSYEIMVPFGHDFRESFHQMHEKIYGYCNRDKEVEVVNVRLRALGKPDKPEFPRMPFAGERMVDDVLLGKREVVFDGKHEQTRILDREKLRHGNLVEGPAILVEYSSTIVIPPFASGRVDAFGNIILSINE
jgi:N-methylhydantoinase A